MSTERDSLAGFPLSGPGSRNRRRWFLGVSAGLLALVLVVSRQVLVPFALAVVVAYVLAPVVAAGQRLKLPRGRRPSRGAVVLVLYSLLVAVIVGLSWLFVPRLLTELGRLTREIPGALTSVRERVIPELDRRIRSLTAPYLAQEPEVPPTLAAEEPKSALDIRPRPGGGYSLVLPPDGIRVVRESDKSFRIEPTARPHAQTDVSSAIKDAAARLTRDTEQTTLAVLRIGQAFLQGLVIGVFDFALMLMMSAYMLLTREQIFGFARSLYAPGRRGNFDDLMRRIDRGLSGVVRGQVIICAINGALSGLGFFLLDLPYWVFLTIIATLLSIVPIFGAVLSSIPAVVVALPLGMSTALLTLAWIIAIHQLEANVLNPKILGDAARVHPVLVIFALLAGEHVAGAIGALLAVPTLSIVQTLFLYLREAYLGVPRASAIPPPPAA